MFDALISRVTGRTARVGVVGLGYIACRCWCVRCPMSRSREVRGAKVLAAGLTCKKNIHDILESPALESLTLLRGLGAEVSYHDPHCPEIPPTREYGALQGMRSLQLAGAFHAVVVMTDHDAVDWEMAAKPVPVIVDTRNVSRDAHMAGTSRIVIA